MKEVVGNLEIEFFNEGDLLKVNIREVDSLEWSVFKRIWRNLRYEHIDYPDIWFNIVSKLKEKFEGSEIIIELYPSEAANIRGLIEDEIKLLEKENSASEIYSKKLAKLGSNYQFIFNIESKKYLKKLISIYYAHQSMNIYLISQRDKYKFASLLSEYQGSSLEDYLIKRYQEPFCFITTDIDMYLVTNHFTSNDIVKVIGCL